MRIAFLGAGSIAERHIDAIRRTGAGEISWIISRTQERAEALASKKGIPNAGCDPRRAIESPEIDFVVVAYPTFLHGPLAIDALRAGKHVVVEKPIAETAEEAQAMVSAANESHRHVLVCQLRRFWPTYAAVKAFLHAEKAGRANRLTFDFQAHWSWASRGWRIQRPGGYFLDMHVHEVDLVSWWVGTSPLAVTGFGQNVAEREGAVLLQFPEALGQITFSGRIFGKTYPAGSTSAVQIACSGGWVEVEVADGTVTLTTNAHGVVERSQRGIGEENTVCWDRMWMAFSSAIAGDAPPPLTGAEATASLTTALAGVDAMQSGKVVDLSARATPYASS